MVPSTKKQRITILPLVLLILLWNSCLRSEAIDNNHNYCFSHYIRGVRNIWNLNYQKTVYTAGLIAIPISLVLDKPLQDYIQKYSFYSDKISSIGDFYGHRWGYYLAFSSIFITSYINGSSRSETLSAATLMLESVLTTATVTKLLKRSVYRQRPIGYGRNSFPSGHTSGSFALAVVINHLYGKTAGRIAYGMAVFVASSRINDQKHYLSDVVTGALIGILIGRSFTKEHQNRICWSIQPTPNTIQIGITFPL